MSDDARPLPSQLEMAHITAIGMATSNDVSGHRERPRDGHGRMIKFATQGDHSDRVFEARSGSVLSAVEMLAPTSTERGRRQTSQVRMRRVASHNYVGQARSAAGR